MSIDKKLAEEPKKLYFFYDKVLSEHFLLFKQKLSEVEELKNDPELLKTKYRKAITLFNRDVLPIGMGLMRDVERGIILVTDWDVFGIDKDVFVEVLLKIYEQTFFYDEGITVPQIDLAFNDNKSFWVYVNNMMDYFIEAKNFMYHNLSILNYSEDEATHFVNRWCMEQAAQIYSYMPTIPMVFYSSEGYLHIVGPWDIEEPGVMEEVSDIAVKAWDKYCEYDGAKALPDFDEMLQEQVIQQGFPDWVVINYPMKETNNPSYVNSLDIPYHTTVPDYTPVV